MKQYLKFKWYFVSLLSALFFSASLAQLYNLGAFWKQPSGPKMIYRSVGPGNTSILACGSTGGGCTGQGNLTISGTTATFASAVANKIGVGDVIVYDCSNNSALGAGDCVAFISGRTSSTVYTVQDKSGSTPTAYGAQVVWRIYRAYTSLDNAAGNVHGGTENSAIKAIDTSLGNFDSFSGGKDIVTSRLQWNIALYADGVDTVGIDVSGWTTGAGYALKIYAPFLSSEVGVSQRHSGVWTSSGYQFVVTGAPAPITTTTSNLIIDGLQIMWINREDDAGAIGGDWVVPSYQIVVSNCIIMGAGLAGSNSGGIFFENGQPSTMSFYNNIIYGFTGAGEHGIGMSDWGGSGGEAIYVYNNTLINNGLEASGSQTYTMLAKNNIVMGATFDGDKFDSASDYNVSDYVNSTGGAHDKINTGVVFRDPSSNDFRLSNDDSGAKGAGVNLSSDTHLAFVTDIAGNTRTSPWDVGASMASGPTPIYRSIGPGNTTSLADGTNNNLTIDSLGNATFSNPLPLKIGVGDALQYASSGTSIDSIAFIYRRISSTVYQIRSASGGMPTVRSNFVSWSIFRAYTSLANAVDATMGGSENTGINAAVRNFDTWSGGKNIVSANEQWFFACYRDATDSYTASIDLSNWTTSSTNSIEIYTPYHINEVGMSQRHSGTWGSLGYTLTDSYLWGPLLNIATKFVKIEGLKIEGSGDSGNGMVQFFDATNSGSAYFGDNLIHGTGSYSSGGRNAIYMSSSGSQTVHMYNNIIHDMTDNVHLGNNVVTLNGISYVYNNTILAGGQTAFLSYSNLALLKNNIVQGAASAGGYANGMYNSSSNYNLSNETSSTGGINDLTNKTVTFSDSTSMDYRLSYSDSVAKSAGVNLSADAYLAFTDDNQGLTRLATWDLGASRSTAIPIFRSVGPSNTGILACGSTGGGCTGSGNLVIAGSTATFASAIPNNVGVGDALIYDCSGDNSLGSGDCIAFIYGRTDSTHYMIRNSTGGIPTVYGAAAQWRIYRAYTSLLNAQLDWTGTENSAIRAIDATLGSFDDDFSWSTDLVSYNYQWNIALYADAADTSSFSYYTWANGPFNYLRIYAPSLSTEVGVSQKHNGVWSTSAARVAPSASPGASIFSINYVNYARIDGIQIQVPSNMTGIATEVDASLGVAYNASSDIRISNMLIKILWANNNTDSTGIVTYGGINYIYNNIVYCSGSGNDYPIGIDFNTSGNGSGGVYNNTVVGCSRGIGWDATSSLIVFKNNIASNNAFRDYQENWDSISPSLSITNLSSDATSANTALRNKTVTFVNAGAADYRLSTADVSAKGAGTDLSADYYFPFVTDITNIARTVPWDIGATTPH